MLYGFNGQFKISAHSLIKICSASSGGTLKLKSFRETDPTDE